MHGMSTRTTIVRRRAPTTPDGGDVLLVESCDHVPRTSKSRSAREQGAGCVGHELQPLHTFAR